MSGIDQFCAVLRAVYEKAPDARYTLTIDGERRNAGPIEDVAVLETSARRLHAAGRALALQHAGMREFAQLSCQADGALFFDAHWPEHGPISHDGGQILACWPAEEIAADILRDGER